MQDAVDAVEPDPRLPFNWVRAYREGLYAQSEEAHKKAERVGEPREPEMRLVLEGELTEAPAGATVRPPVQHSTAGPYQLPLSLLQHALVSGALHLRQEAGSSSCSSGSRSGVF